MVHDSINQSVNQSIRDRSCAGEFQIICVGALHSRSAKTNSPPTRCGLHVETSFRSVHYDKAQKGSTAAGTPEEYDPSQVIKVNINSDKPYSRYAPFSLASMVFFPKFQLTMRKTLEKTKLKDSSPRYLACTFENCQGDPKKDTVGNCRSQEAALKTGRFKYNVLPWMGSWDIQGTRGGK